MRMLLLMGIIALSNLALANESTEINYSFSSFRSAYSCHYAETQFQEYVEALGGEIESIRCSGGIPYDDHFVAIRAQVRVPQVNENTRWVSVELEGDEACKFNDNMIQELLNHFATRNLEHRSSCWHSQGRYKYSFDVAN
ncbi:MAG: hypothetical protein R2827_13425 [Bdellovibrionales bacterium]